MGETPIAWTQESINTLWGCFRVDIDPLTGACVNCYMFRMAPGFGKDPNVANYREMKNVLRDCRNAVRKGHDRAFFNSMSDTFWEQIPFETIEMWHIKIIEAFPTINFQLLTKRIGRAYQFYKQRGSIPKNVWIGTSIGAKDTLFRINYLRKIKTMFPDTIVWISFEPLLEDMGGLTSYSLKDIDWVVVGGESDRSHPRPMKPEWAENIRAMANAYDVAFFYKQSGGIGTGGAGGNLLAGVKYENYPKKYLDGLNKK